MSEELKTCPFCGSKGKPEFEHFISIDDSPVDSVMCEKCGIYFETYTRDDVDALTLWNTRPLEDAKDKEIERLKGNWDYLKEYLVALRNSRLHDENLLSSEMNRHNILFLNQLIEKMYNVDNNVRSIEE